MSSHRQKHLAEDRSILSSFKIRQIHTPLRILADRKHVCSQGHSGGFHNSGSWKGPHTQTEHPAPFFLEKTSPTPVPDWSLTGYRLQDTRVLTSEKTRNKRSLQSCWKQMSGDSGLGWVLEAVCAHTCVRAKMTSGIARYHHHPNHAFGDRLSLSGLELPNSLKLAGQWVLGIYLSLPPYI